MTSTEIKPTAITKALTVLRLAGRGESVSIPELVQETGYPRPTVVRIIQELTAQGFLERVERGCYCPGPAIRALAGASGGDDAQRARIREQLRHLARETDETAHYAVYEEGYGVSVDKIDGAHPVRVYTRIGGRAPAYLTANGKALLAWQPAREIDRVARMSKPQTVSTIVGVAALREEMARIREQGYAVNRGERHEEIWAVASPVFNADGQVAGSIGVAGLRSRMEPRIESLTALIRAAAAAL